MYYWNFFIHHTIFFSSNAYHVLLRCRMPILIQLQHFDIPQKSPPTQPKNNSDIIKDCYTINTHKL